MLQMYFNDPKKALVWTPPHNMVSEAEMIIVTMITPMITCDISFLHDLLIIKQ